MDIDAIVTEFEAALSQQVAMAGDDPAVQMASDAMLSALYPAVRHLVLGAAEQAAIEVGAQLPDHSVEVVLSEGEPQLRVRAPEEAAQVPYSTGDLEARLTLRLPGTLKEAIEDAAGLTGDSVNSYVVKSLSARAGGKAKWNRKRIQGTIHT